MTMLETIREFGQEMLRESGEEDATRDRHAACFRAFITALDLHHSVAAEAVQRLVPDEDNLRQALTRFAALGNALALNDVSAALDMYWLSRSQYEEATFWLERALASDPKHSRTWSYYGMWHAEQGNLLKAREHLAKVASLCGTTCRDYTELKGVIEGTRTY